MCLMLATVTFGQKAKSKLLNSHLSSKTSDTSYVLEKPTSPITPYVSGSLSMSNTSDFRNGSYFSLETGVCKDNVALGVVLGRGYLSGAFKNGDKSSNYFYETKASGSFPLGKLNGVLFFGVGGYFNTSHTFIEYGTGFYYQINHLSYGVSYSNWDGVNYVTPNITYNF